MGTNLSRNERYMVIDDESTNIRTIFSADPIELETVRSPDRALKIFADEVIIADVVRTAGHHIEVYCRAMTFSDGAVIDTSGKDGTPSARAGYPPQPESLPGSIGPNGSAGGNGDSAGNVTIAFKLLTGTPRLRANGGQGGRGQDGGNGRKGLQGTDGGAARLENQPTVEPVPRSNPATGGTGGAGGARGLPGLSGNGGSGGQILIRGTTAGSVIPEAAFEGGKAGEAASPGSVGLGGDGGRPGTVVWYDCVDAGNGHFKDVPAHLLHPNTKSALLILSTETPKRTVCTEREHHQAQTGLPGKDGDLRAAELASLPKASDGAKGSISITPDTLESFGALFPEAFLEMLINAVEDEYRIVGRPSGGDTQLAADIEFLLVASSAGAAADSQRRAIYDRAYMMATRLRLGLDFFGYGPFTVPLASFDIYRQLLSSMLPHIKDVDDAFKKYFDQNAQEEDAQASARSVVANSRIAAKRLNDQYNDTAVLTDAQLKQLDALELQLGVAYGALVAARDKLAEAVERRNDHKCNFVSTLISVGTIVAGIASGGSSLIATVGASSKLLKDYEDAAAAGNSLWKARDILGQDLKDLGGDAERVEDSIEKVRKALEGQPLDSLPMPQLVMKREEIDRMVEAYAGMPEAAEFKEAAYGYVGLCEARNQAILNYNGLLTMLSELQAMQFSATDTLERADSYLASIADPGAAWIVAFMGRMRRDSLAGAARLVHLEGKALNYLLGGASNFSLSAFDYASVAYAHETLSGKWASAMDDFRSRRNLTPETWTLSLEDFVSNDEWRRFKASPFGSQSINFAIRFNHEKYQHLFQNQPLLRITGVRIEMPGASVSATIPTQLRSIPWLLAQGGTERMYVGASDARTFVHKMVSVHGLTPMAANAPQDDADFAQNDFFAGVSPFAVWNLTISGTPQLGVDLGALEAVNLVLLGYFVESLSRPV